MSLLDLISRGVSIKKLSDLLPEQLAHNLFKKELLKFDAKYGAVLAESYARSLTKTIDTCYDVTEVSIEDRDRVAKQLAINGALQLAKVAEELADYPKYAKAVAQAKADDNATSLDEAREKRKEAQSNIRRALTTMGRALTGFL